MKRFWWLPAAVFLTAGYVWLAAAESRDREAARPEPAPIGVTVDPNEPIGTAQLADGGFDFAAVRWSAKDRPAAVRAVREIEQDTGLSYAFFLPGKQAGEAAFDALAADFAGERWFTYRGKPLVYVFGSEKIPEQKHFSIIRIDNGPSGDQYWVANPPNIKYGFMTLTPSFTGGGLRIDPSRTGDTLDQQESFAETNKDRAVLLLWHSWNVPEDGSALLPSAVTDAVNPPDYAYERVRGFNERWKHP